MKWRLPTEDELKDLKTNFSTYSKGKGSNGLMLCDSSSGAGSEQCQTEQTQCQNIGLYACGAHIIVGETKSSYVQSGVMASPVTPTGNILGSVRCVADI